MTRNEKIAVVLHELPEEPLLGMQVHDDGTLDLIFRKSRTFIIQQEADIDALRAAAITMRGQLERLG